MFQSSSGLSTGRYGGPRRQEPGSGGFQSSSGLSTGRYLGFGLPNNGKPSVSILVRPFDRTLLVERPGSDARKDLFQSSSGLSTGRYLGLPVEIERRKRRFQSSSGLSTGRYDMRGDGSPPSASFNPRPAFRPDATRSAQPGLAQGFANGRHALFDLPTEGGGELDFPPPPGAVVEQCPAQYALARHFLQADSLRKAGWRPPRGCGGGRA